MVGVSLKVQSKGKLKKIYEVVSLALHKQWFLFQNEVVDLAYKTRDVMRQRIEETRKREQGEGQSLTDLIDVEILDTTAKIHLGIGNINKLNEKAPYWYVINYGKKMNSDEVFIPAGGKAVPPGAFSQTGKPTRSASGERWIVGKEQAISKFGKYFTFHPKKPIEPKHYIEAGRYYFKNKLVNIVKSYRTLTRKGW